MSDFLLEIITPEKQFFKGSVEAIRCETLGGEIGVLKGHQPMVAALKIGEIRLKIAGEWKNAFNSEGFMEVRPDEVMIFSQSCEWPEDIDEARAEEARLRILETMRHEQGLTEHKHNEISLARAMARLKLKRGSNNPFSL